MIGLINNKFKNNYVDGCSGSSYSCSRFNNGIVFEEHLHSSKLGVS